jgi:hypothetical protein
MHIIEAAVVAYLFGVFTPAISRKVKSYFAAEGDKAKAAVQAEIKKI